MAKADAAVTKIKSLSDLPANIPSGPLSPQQAAKFSPITKEWAEQWFEAMLRKARKEGVFIVEDTLTAPLARLLLDNNPDNRPVSKPQVDQLAHDMRNGNFDSMNGQTFQISICGLLNDGQNRLHAKLQANVDFPARFMFGLPREARLTIDQNRPRTAGDYLAMDGFAGGGAAAAVGSLLLQWRTEGAIRGKGGNTNVRAGRSETARFTRENYEQIRASLDAIKSRRGLGLIGGIGLIGFCHLILAERHFAGATEFINKLISGSELSENSPINVARQRFISNNRLKREEKFELIIRAWNAWRRKDTPKNFMIIKKVPAILD